jgi:Arc/MetJ-type ribon-helix-helix transcriptional regulator
MNPKTANLNISLPTWMKKQVEQDTVKLGFANTSEYVRSLFREARAKLQKAEFDQTLLEAMKEPARPYSDADWAELERPLRESHPELFQK